MKRARMTALVAAVVAIGAFPLIEGATASAGNTRGHAAAPSDAPTVSSLAGMLEQFRWGQTHVDVARVHNQTGGLFDIEYNPRLARMQPGVAMQSVEAERDQKKKFFEQSYVQFLDTPTGFDNTNIKGEYTYRNHEAVMYVDRLGKRRYFFFFGTPPADRLWKILDDVPLKADGPLGRTYQEAITKLNVQLSTPARIRPANPSQGVMYTTADWQDGATHLRAEDRGQSVVVVLEERATLSSLGQLRANKEVDPLAMDPSIQAITHGGISDPNATHAVDAGAPRRRH
ncbi:MAG TPA: hypothetical protein VLM85_07515 [Polyangiaceae bacterium]|nr:hypothetical protein [Polyangiaceae bacterium]